MSRDKPRQEGREEREEREKSKRERERKRGGGGDKKLTSGMTNFFSAFSTTGTAKRSTFLRSRGPVTGTTWAPCLMNALREIGDEEVTDRVTMGMGLVKV